MGRLSEWIVSSVQPLVSCLSPSNEDEKPVTAKTTKRRRFWMINRSQKVAPDMGEITATQIGKLTSDPVTLKPAGKTSGSHPSLDKLRRSHKGIPLPVPSEASTRTKSKKTKGDPSRNGCKNAHHDPREIRQRLVSKCQKDEKASKTAVSGSSNGKEDMMKKIDQELRKKVEKVFGNSATGAKILSAKVSKDEEPKLVPAHSRSDDLGITEKVLKTSIRHHSRDKQRKLKKNRVNVINDAGKRNAELNSNESHDDDDDIVIGKPDIAPIMASANEDRMEVIEIDGYETHDDDDDIVIGKPDIASREASANISRLEVVEIDGYETHDDDDDIVFGFSGTGLCEQTSRKPPTPEKSGFIEIIQDIADTLGEIKSRTTEQSNHDTVNMFYNGRLGSGLSSLSTEAGATSQTQNPGYGLLIKDLADRLGEMKASNCDAQARRREMQSLLKTGNIMNLNQFQSLASGTSKPK